MSSPSRRVVLVCGPPCAGKTTYVQQHAQPGDMILDLDALARQAGSTRTHAHSAEHWTAAHARFERTAQQIGRAEQVRAWVVRCAATPAERQWWARHVDATEVVVVAPPAHVVQARAVRTRTRSARAAIARWYSDYRTAPCDTTVSGSLPPRT